MLVSRESFYFTLLTSCLAFGALESAYAGSPNDLPGYSPEAAVQNNRGVFVFLDGYHSPTRQTQERRKELAQATVHELVQDPKNAKLLEQFGNGYVRSTENSNFAGASWVYGMNPGVDWRATFKGNPEMRDAFQQLFPPLDENTSEDEQGLYEIAKARFAQDWIMATQRQTLPLKPVPNIQTSNWSDCTQNIHRLLPQNKDKDQEETSIYDLVLEIPSSRHLEFINAAEPLLTEDMNIDQRMSVLRALKYFSESGSTYTQAAPTIQKWVALLQGVGSDSVDVFSQALKPVLPQDRQAYVDQLTQLYTEKMDPSDNLLFAKALTRVEDPKDYPTLLANAAKLADQNDPLAYAITLDVLSQVSPDQQEAFINFVKGLGIPSQEIPGALKYLVLTEPKTAAEATRLITTYRPATGYPKYESYIAQALVAAVKFPSGTSDAFFKAALPLLRVLGSDNDLVFSMLEKVGPENFQAFSDQAKDIVPNMNLSDLEILENEITPENFREKLIQAGEKFQERQR